MHKPLWMNANESFLPMPEPVAERLTALIAKTPLHRYPDPQARAVSEAFRSYYGLGDVGIVCGNGSDELIDLLMRLVLSPGDGLLTVDPDFSMYRHYAQLNGLRHHLLAKGEDRTLSAEALLAAANAYEVQMILFSNPCNPTSLGVPRAMIEHILAGYNGYLVIDEAYMDFWTESVLDLVEQHPRLIVLRTASKALGMAGLRLGFAVMEKRLAAAVQKDKSPYNVSLLSQRIGAAVYSEPEAMAAQIAILQEASAALNARLRAFAEEMPDWRVFAGVTNFTYVEMPDPEPLAQALAEAGIYVRVFNEPAALRLSAVAAADLERLMEALAAWKGARHAGGATS